MDLARRPGLLSAAAGAGLWCAVSALTGRAEAWDTGVYWSVGYPLLMATAAYLGWNYPDRPWRWGFTASASQVIPMAVINGFGGSSLLPLGLIAFGFLSLPLIAASVLAARVRRRRETGVI